MRYRDRAIGHADEGNLVSLQDSLLQLKTTIPTAFAGNAAWKAWHEQLQQVMIAERNIGHEWDWTEERVVLFERYLQANLLLVECLDVAYMPSDKREAFKGRLLLPPAK